MLDLIPDVETNKYYYYFTVAPFFTALWLFSFPVVIPDTTILIFHDPGITFFDIVNSKAYKIFVLLLAAAPPIIGFFAERVTYKVLIPTILCIILHFLYFKMNTFSLFS